MSSEKLNKIRDLKTEILFLTQRIQELVSEIDVEVLSLITQSPSRSETGATKVSPEETDVKPPYKREFDSHNIRPDINKVTKEEKHLNSMDEDEKTQPYYRSWSDDESDPSPVSTEDYFSQASISEEDEDTDNFRSHLERYGIKMTFVPILSVRNAKAYACSVFGYTAKGVAKTKKAAKKKAMVAVAKTIIKKQEEGVLPTDIQPFACDELANLMSMIERNDRRDYVNDLKVVCQEMESPPPEYLVLATPNQKDCKTFTVKCCALSYCTLGVHEVKKKAKMNSAREIIKLHEGMALD